MQIDHERRLAVFGVGELAVFSPGPSPAESGPAGRWRAELGSQWHREKRAAAEAEALGGELAPRHEVAMRGALSRGGWRFELDGRIDQWRPAPGGARLRELKTTLVRLPRPADELRAAHPGHFHQLGLYLELAQAADPGAALIGELLYVEAATGLEQVVTYGEADRAALESHLAATADFLEARRGELARLRTLRWRPAFAAPRPGQETIVAELGAALARTRATVLAAPTGYGKTGVLLEAAFAALREGRADRLVYLTGKATGQLHVLATLRAMLADGEAEGVDPGPGLSAWHLRPKREHCINAVFHCTADRCSHLRDLPARWARSGLARFHLFPAESRDLPALRAAGLGAGVCPYEIARASLPGCRVWVGDFNYVFAPANRGVFYERPTWEPARTLLVVDEAHHLPARVAEAYSHALTADELHLLLGGLDETVPRALRRAWEQLWSLVAGLPAADALDLDTEDDLTAGLREAKTQWAKYTFVCGELAPEQAETVQRIATLAEWLEDGGMDRLVWTPRPGEVRFTCLDAAPMIGEQLRGFGTIALATATPPPAEVFAGALGLDPAELAVLKPAAPWRSGAYDVAFDLRADTTYRRRAACLGLTAATLAALRAASPNAPVAAFFPSHAYAESAAARLEADYPALRAALPPRVADLAAREAWIEESLALADVLFFVLGGSFAEGIDHLGCRISHALVAGPALPEVNALQRAREASLVRVHGATEAFRRAYLVPGLQKVNQALGRLVRAPGQRARVVLHCRRFAEPEYAGLLAPEYQLGHRVLEDGDLADWLESGA